MKIMIQNLNIIFLYTVSNIHLDSVLTGTDYHSQQINKYLN